MTIIIQICQQTEILIFSINKIEKIYVIIYIMMFHTMNRNIEFCITFLF